MERIVKGCIWIWKRALLQASWWLEDASYRAGEGVFSGCFVVRGLIMDVHGELQWLQRWGGALSVYKASCFMTTSYLHVQEKR